MSPMTLIREYRYEIIAFLTGASVMVLEIVGARLIAPYFGTTTYVWTAMIGVILGALAVGYATGGRLADKDQAAKSLGVIILMAAALVFALGLLQKPLLSTISEFAVDPRISTLLGASLLFGPPSMLIGMVSPHLAKVRVTSLQTTGKHIGRLEAAGALGSIAGTFACGYFLLGLFGSQAIVFGVVILLALTSILAAPRVFVLFRSMLIIGALGLAIVGTPREANELADIDTPYGRYRVLDMIYGGEPTTVLAISNGFESGISKRDPNKPLFSYVQRFNDALHQFPEAKSVLVIGGGTYTFPSIVARQHPDITVDVVEIDKQLTTVARQYFNYGDRPNLHIINEDGRTYLNNASRTYDLIFFDAYNSLSPPFQLTTHEALARAERLLTPEGIIISNIIGTKLPSQDRFLQAMQATAASVFSNVQVHPARANINPELTQNYILYASNNPESFSKLTRDLASPAITTNHGALILSDNFAPIEQLVGRPM